MKVEYYEDGDECPNCRGRITAWKGDDGWGYLECDECGLDISDSEKEFKRE